VSCFRPIKQELATVVDTYNTATVGASLDKYKLARLFRQVWRKKIQTPDPVRNRLAKAGFKAVGIYPFDPQWPAKHPEKFSVSEAFTSSPATETG